MLVQKLRLQKGWTQEQLALVSGVSSRTVQRIERGEPASAETLKSLAAVFEVDFQSLKEPNMEPEQQPDAAPKPAPTTPEPDRRQSAAVEEMLAFQQVRRLRGFYSHAVTYVVVIAFLACLNLYSSPHTLWVIYAALGWGVGLALHGFRVFGGGFLWGPAWEKRQAEKILGRPL
ncbi:MAG: helix-turn-helix domain-containing protein [Ancalomicrobiaceae bacterium]|nr:helix-turn-helix domain-containing protein [Ancalomicrobiaceae bacterium]